MNLHQYYNDHDRFSLIGNVDGEMLNAFNQQVRAYFDRPQDERKPVVITITTQGGEGSAGRALYEGIRMLDAVTPVVLVAVGYCNSAGVTVFMAVPKERRFTTLNTEFLVHQPWFEPVKLPKAPLNVRRLQNAEHGFNHDDSERDCRWVVGVLAKGCGKRKKAVLALLTPGTVVTGPQAVEFGLVSGVLV